MLDKHLKLSPDAMFQEIGGEGVILDLKSASYFGLDEVGVRFWQLVQTESGMSAICDKLQQEYNVEPKRLERDITILVEQLLEAGLVTSE